MSLSLKLSSPSKSRLWTLVQGERLVVPTGSSHTPGEILTVEADAPDLAVGLSLTGVVEAQAPGSVTLRLDAASINRCRQAVGFERDQTIRVLGRDGSRVVCDLEARVVRPLAVAGCRVRNVSVGGLTLETPTTFAEGSELEVAVTFPDDEVLLQGEVRWARPEVALCGLKLTLVTPAVAARLTTLVAAGAVRPAPPPTPGAPIQALTVLVADDDPAILDFSSLVITKSGYRAVRADRGDRALDLARRERPALMLLDVLMPGLDGLEVCRAVRADAALRDTPVVLLSAMGEQRLSEAAAQVGATSWLTKPMRIDALRELFSRLLKRPD